MILLLLLFIQSGCGTETEPEIDSPVPDPVVDTKAQYSVTLTLADDIRQIELRFGQQSNPASQDIQIPPSPPEGTLHAHFTKNSKSYWGDFRSEDSKNEEWNFAYQTGSNGSVTLKWSIQTTKFPGSLTLVDPRDDSSIEMEGTGEFELPTSAKGSLLFKYSLE